MLSLLDILHAEFRLPWHGTHGFGHWSRVWAYGQVLARREGVDPLIPHLFAFLHDACRWSEKRDRAHGKRAVNFTRRLWREGYIPLPQQGLDLLCYAIRYHSAGLVEAPPVVGVCWDSDRLDLKRCEVEIKAERLCTEAAKSLVASRGHTRQRRN